jgi:hypothetical protein
MVFVLAGEPTDVTDADVTATDVSSDITDINGDTESIGNRRLLKGGKKVPTELGLGPVSSRKEDEYRASLIDFKMERLNDEREEYRERRDRDRREKLEAERIQRFDEFQVREEQRQIEERQARVRDIIQRVKYTILPKGMDEIIPAHILAYAYQQMEKFLSRTDVCSLPFDELVIFAQGIWDRCSEEFADELAPRARDYLLKLARKQLNQGMRLSYQAYTMRGGSLSYRDFLFSIVAKRTPDKREWFFDMVEPVYRPVSKEELEETKAIATAMSRYSK